MCSLAPKLNISLVHPALIPPPFSLLKNDQVYVKPKICILKGSSTVIPNNSSLNSVKHLKKQQTPPPIRPHPFTMGCLNPPGTIIWSSI